MDHPNLPFGFALPGHSHPPIPPTANMLGPHPSGHPGPTSSPPQSVPGRRTPLGSVGLGGFYAQGLGMLPPGDENKPDSGAGSVMDKASPNLMLAPSTSNTGSGSSVATGLGAGSAGGGGNNGGSSSYAHSPSVRKLSKIATLLLAKNYILMQQNAIEELRRLLAYIQSTTGAAPLDLASFPAAAKLQALLQSAGSEFNDPPGGSS